MTPIFTHLRLLTAIVLLLTGMAMMSCTKTATEAQPKTITDVVLESSDFSILKAAITYAGIGDALKATNLTLFAPNDAAFQASNLTAALLTALPKDSVKKMLLYHVLFSRVLTADIPAGSNAVSTANNQATAYLIKSGTNVFLNNAKVTVADQAVTNGIIHTINRVLLPSRGSILELAQRDPTLSTFLAAVGHVGASYPALSIGPVTIFAPTNAAFAAAGYRSASDINQAPVQTLATMLSYHILPSVQFSPQLAVGQVTTILQAGNNKLTIGTTTPTTTASGITVKGNQNGTAANLLAPPDIDIPITNGVVHKIDQVLKQ